MSGHNPAISNPAAFRAVPPVSGGVASITREIDMFRLLAICCMVLIHVPVNYRAGMAAESLPLSLHVLAFFQYGLGIVASPAMSVLSAWLLMESLRKRSRSTLLSRRATNLLVPYLFWNLTFVAISLTLWRVSGYKHLYISQASWEALFNEGMLGLTAWPSNYPLHYLKDLFIVAACVLLFAPILRRTPRVLLVVIGLAAPALLAYAGTSDGWLGDNKLSLLPRVDIVMFFLIGMATHRYAGGLFSTPLLRSVNHPLVIASGLTALFLLAPTLLMTSKTTSPDWSATNTLLMYAMLALRAAVSVLLLCVAYRIAARTSSAINRKFIFRLFCTHVICIKLMTVILPKTLKQQELVYFGIIYGATLIGCLLLHWCMEQCRKRFSLTLHPAL